MEEKFIDTDVFRVGYTIDKSLVTADEFNAWKDSPLTKALCKMLEYYYIIPAIRLEDNGDIGMHIIGRFDIKKAIIERERNKCKNER